MGKLKIENSILGDIGTNCYYIINKETDRAVIVDPADDALTIKGYCDMHNLKPEAILLTHGHYDHILAADDIRKAYDIKIYAAAAEKPLLNDSMKNLSAAWSTPYTLDADIYINDGDVLKLAGFTIDVISTPGHTEGGVCYYIKDEKVLLSGDTLFEGSYGRTDFPTSSMKKLADSICGKLFKLPDDVMVFPGHGGETSIGYEKDNNPLAGFASNY